MKNTTMTIRIRVDEQRCVGHGRCYSLEPLLFQSDDDGYPVQRGRSIDVPQGSEDAARKAIGNCPGGAISIVD